PHKHWFVLVGFHHPVQDRQEQGFWSLPALQGSVSCNTTMGCPTRCWHPGAGREDGHCIWELQQEEPWAAWGSWIPLQESVNRPGGMFEPSPPPELFSPVPTAASCPRSLDCALQRREFCPPGSGACGPCLPPFQEDDHGHCIQKQLSPSGRSTQWRHPPSLQMTTWCSVSTFLPWALVGRGFTPSSGKHGLVSPCHQLTPWPLVSPLSAGLIVVCTVAGISALIVVAVCWCSAQLEGFPRGVGPPAARLVASKAKSAQLFLLSPQPGDKTLAQSAQMYHYQHQKQQMLSLEKHKEEPKLPDSASSDEENEDGDFTVYECPGLAPVRGCRRAGGLCACGGVQRVPGLCSSSWGAFSTHSSSNLEVVQAPCSCHVPSKLPRELSRAGVHVRHKAFPWEQRTRAALDTPNPPSLW
uniref:Neural proliferation, differentiation and control 1 n=1 Tax=Malurus cyaneus samueli TaxID=2593467 RepID=A0A8C5TZ05_9PASS